MQLKSKFKNRKKIGKNILSELQAKNMLQILRPGILI